MKKLRKEVAHGGRVPRGWHLAWYEPRRRVAASEFTTPRPFTGSQESCWKSPIACGWPRMPRG